MIEMFLYLSVESSREIISGHLYVLCIRYERIFKYPSQLLVTQLLKKKGEYLTLVFNYDPTCVGHTKN